MKDDLDFNINFIELIKRRPCLYDFNQSSYNNRTLQDAAWLEISKEVNESVADCKERWKNLRGCYTRHLKKSKTPPGTAKRVKPYYLADQLKFIDKFTRPRQPKNVKQEEGNEIAQESMSDDDDLEDSREFVAPVASCNVTATPIDYYQPRQKMPKLEDTQDPDLSFLYSLLPDVNDMNPEQKRRFKIGVLKLASDILQESTMSAASPKSDSYTSASFKKDC